MAESDVSSAIVDKLVEKLKMKALRDGGCWDLYITAKDGCLALIMCVPKGAEEWGRRQIQFNLGQGTLTPRRT